MKREKKERMERELPYSSFSAEQEECASGALFLFFLFINITQHISVTLIEYCTDICREKYEEEAFGTFKML